MSTLRVQMHLDRNAAFFQPRVVAQRFLDAVDRIILVLQQERRRRLRADVRADVRIQRDAVLGQRQVPRIQRDSEIRTAAFLVRRIDRLVRTLREMRADVRDQVAASGKSEHADLVRVDMPLGGVQAQQSDCSLRVLQRRGLLAPDGAPAPLERPPMASVRAAAA